MEPNYSWIYLAFFLIIPLTRILPRLIAKMRGKEYSKMQYQGMGQGMSQQRGPEIKRAEIKETNTEQQKAPQTNEMLVLGSMHRGANTFEKIQSVTNMQGKELDPILQELEDKEFIKIVHKKGMLGPKVELYPTDKGFKEFYS